MTLRRLIEANFRKFGCKKFPDYHRWLSVEKTALLLNIPEHKVLSFVSESATVHGLLFNKNPLIVHPNTVFKRVSQKKIREIRAELRVERGERDSGLRLKRDPAEIGDSVPEAASNR